MAWYGVWRSQQGEVTGFIYDGGGNPNADPADCPPQKWDSEKEAEEAMKGHSLEYYTDIVEL